MNTVRYQINSYKIQVFAVDLKGRRTRWGEKLIKLFSEGREVAHAVFAEGGRKLPEPYFSDGKIYYFAPNAHYEAVIDLLRSPGPLYIVWEPIHDPKEPNDGDAYFCTDIKERALSKK